MYVLCGVTDPDDAHRVFAALADGGHIDVPIAESSFSPAFGVCVDRFGTPWMVTADGAVA